MNREKQLGLPWGGRKAVDATRRRPATWHFGDRDRRDPTRLDRQPQRSQKPVPRGEHASRHRNRMAELATELPEYIRFGTVGYRYPQWGALVFDSARTPESIAAEGIREYGAQPLFRCLGLPSRELVPNERELLWELLELPEPVTPVLMLNPGLSTPMFPRRRLLDAATGEVGDAGHFNPAFLDPRLFRDEVFPVLEEVRAVGECRVEVTGVAHLAGGRI
ncbi:MAG: hypothetical protein AAFX94_06245, partial [Myxococcota bacterium]